MPLQANFASEKKISPKRTSSNDTEKLSFSINED